MLFRSNEPRKTFEVPGEEEIQEQVVETVDDVKLTEKINGRQHRQIASKRAAKRI